MARAMCAGYADPEVQKGIMGAALMTRGDALSDAVDLLLLNGFPGAAGLIEEFNNQEIAQLTDERCEDPRLPPPDGVQA